MCVIPTGGIVALIIVAVLIVLFLIILLVCCLCRKCEQCARWSRRKATAKEEAIKDREMVESRREFDAIRQEHNALRDQLRVKYNLNGDNSNARVVP